MKHNDFRGSGSKVRSLVRLGKLATVEEAILEGMLGEVSSERLRRSLGRLRSHLEREIGEDPGSRS